ncbi:hypothetical protein ASE59_05575 [Sphingomonas sp. Leaf10]|nr:hypothetical protein ASE59_05575 [Sphingomonas sp. Leaf10]
MEQNVGLHKAELRTLTATLDLGSGCFAQHGVDRTLFDRISGEDEPVRLIQHLTIANNVDVQISPL